MYKINRESNCLQPIAPTSFKNLGFSERYHLQEWLAKHPQALTQNEDDELLIIQKEFAGFEETRERLDLLALNKSGNLVIIENKLDDSGRDVAWQALKYAGYCANLLRDDIINIFQRYLDRYQPNETRSAVDIIIEFMKCDSLEELELNQARTQHIIFVAANFRPEVTNTVLWLMQFNLKLQCFTVTPYQYGDDVLLDVRQVLPTPEVEEYMIGMARKDGEEQASSDTVRERQQLRQRFWSQLLDKLRDSPCSLYNNMNPSTEHWLSTSSSVSGISYSLVFSRKEVRVELYFSRNDAELNSFAFEWLQSRREEIEQRFGQPLTWQPLPGKKACRIQYAWPINGSQEENWPIMIDWFVEHLTALEEALTPLMPLLQRAIQKYISEKAINEEPNNMLSDSII